MPKDIHGDKHNTAWQNHSARLTRSVAKLDKRLGNSLSILFYTYLNFNNIHASQAAAAISYYLFFSLFPLLLVLVYFLSFYLEQENAIRYVIEVVMKSIPISPELIEENLQQIIHARGAIGIIGLVFLVWSASRAFYAVIFNINLAWSGKKVINNLRGRLIALLIVIILNIFLLLSIFLRSFLAILPEIYLPNLQITLLEASRILSILEWIIPFAALFSLYRWIPAVHVHTTVALISAIAATIAWRVASLVFTFLINSGIANYERSYGTMATIIIVLLWYYIAATIVLLGAHLGATIGSKPRRILFSEMNED